MARVLNPLTFRKVDDKDRHGGESHYEKVAKEFKEFMIKQPDEQQAILEKKEAERKEGEAERQKEEEILEAKRKEEEKMVVLTLMETVEKYYGKQVIDNMIKEEEIKNDEWIQSYQNILHCYICGREGPTSIERPYCDYCYRERSIGLR